MGIVIRYSKSGNNKMTVSVLVVYENWSTSVNKEVGLTR